MDGMEITQFTYFQQVGGLECYPVMGEITYGLERLALYLQGVEDFRELILPTQSSSLITSSSLTSVLIIELCGRQNDCRRSNNHRCGQRNW